MKQRVAMWAAVGLSVAGCWAIVALMLPVTIPVVLGRSAVWNFAVASQPVALLSIHFHFGMRFYWVMFANAITYGLVGLMVESLRRSLHHPR